MSPSLSSIPTYRHRQRQWRWKSGTYRIENTISYALERARCVALHKGSSRLRRIMKVLSPLIYVFSLKPILLNLQSQSSSAETNQYSAWTHLETSLYPQPRRPLSLETYKLSPTPLPFHPPRSQTAAVSPSQPKKSTPPKCSLHSPNGWFVTD